jgi:hypothetical protein
MRKESVRQSRHKLSCCVKQIKCTPKYSYNDGNKEQSAGYAWARRYYCSSTSRQNSSFPHGNSYHAKRRSIDPRAFPNNNPSTNKEPIRGGNHRVSKQRNLYEGHAASAVNGNRFGENRRVIPSSERALTGGLMMVMTATPSARTSMVVMPLAIYGNGYQ